MNQDLIIALLKDEVIPATGCTEPGAVALAAAHASEVIDGPIKNVEVIVNANIYKNGIAVGIPGTGQEGLLIAAALGVIKKHSERKLSVLEGVTKEELQQAQVMLEQNKVSVRVDESQTGLWVQVIISTDNEWSEVIIKDKHTNVIDIRRNGNTVFCQDNIQSQRKYDTRAILRDDNLKVSQLIETIESIPVDDLRFVLDGVLMNTKAAEVGLAKKLGMGIGAAYEEMVAKGLLSNDLINYAKTLTAAATDARMSGENIYVMSSAGSGNHGLTVILPVYAVAKKLNVSEDRLIKAIAISHLVTIYVKVYTGSLSALCGCAVAAATGASAAITWLMDGDYEAISAAIKNNIGNLAGMICDGGKVGCALKLSTAAAVAVESSLLAKRNIVVPDTNGIIAPAVEDTVKNLGKLSNPGMLTTDRVILDILLSKESAGCAV